MNKSRIKLSKKLFSAICLIIIGLLCCGYFNVTPYINTDIKKYQNYIVENAEKAYKNKWNMNESIFPKEINDNMNVEDYKMIYCKERI